MVPKVVRCRQKMTWNITRGIACTKQWYCPEHQPHAGGSAAPQGRGGPAGINVADMGTKDYQVYAYSANK